MKESVIEFLSKLNILVQAQLTELNNIQQTLYDLERNHAKIKQQ